MKANLYHTQAHCKWRKSAVTFSVSRKNSFVFDGDLTSILIKYQYTDNYQQIM